MANSRANKRTSKKTRVNEPQIQYNPQMQSMNPMQPMNPMIQMQPMMQMPMQFNPMMQMQMQMQQQQFNPMMQMQMNPYGYMMMPMPMQSMQQMQHPIQQMQPMKSIIKNSSLINTEQNKVSKRFNDIIDNLDNLDTEDEEDNTEEVNTEEVNIEEDNAEEDNAEEIIPKKSNKKRKTMVEQEIKISHPKVKIPEEIENPIPPKPLHNTTTATATATATATTTLNSLSSLTNLFDNVLDNSKMNKKQKTDVSFLPYKDGRNVVKSVYPLNLNDSHFNSDKYPEEKYYIQFLDGHNETIAAKDINDSALETQKITSEHNKNIIKMNPNDLLSQPNTVIYVRCSKPNDSSIDTQKAACFEYALKHNMQVLPFGYLEDNGIPARNGKNFKLGELSVFMSHVPDNGNIIIYSPDRWSRHTLKGLQELEDLVKRNITIHFINNDIKYNKNTSSAHKAIIQSELMTAEKQSNDTSEKIKGTLKRLKSEGHVIGKAPYGFTNTIINGIRTRILNDKEKQNIESIKHKYNDVRNNFNMYAVTDNINLTKTSILKFIMRWSSRIGMKNRNGNGFSYSQIKIIVESQ